MAIEYTNFGDFLDGLVENQGETYEWITRDLEFNLPEQKA